MLTFKIASQYLDHPNLFLYLCRLSEILETGLELNRRQRKLSLAEVEMVGRSVRQINRNIRRVLGRVHIVEALDQAECKQSLWVLFKKFGPEMSRVDPDVTNNLSKGAAP